MALKQLFGTNVRHYRKAHGLTQDSLAERLSLSTQMISKLERGEVAASFETIEALADLFAIDPAALFSLGVATFPPGERGQVLRRINLDLGRLSTPDLAKAAKVVGALK